MTAETETKHSKPGEAENPTIGQRKLVSTTDERKMIMAERLMSLADLSEILSVPVTSSISGGTVERVRPAIGLAGMSVTAGRMLRRG